MKFTDSPVIELPVGHDILRIEQDNGSMHVGTSVWPCSLVVVKFVERCLLASNPNPNPGYAQVFQFKNKRGIELGTGCGVAGMGLGILGLDMVLTDIAPVLPALKRNVKKNTAATSLASAGKPGSGAGRVKISQLYWNNEKQIQGAKWGGGPLIQRSGAMASSFWYLADHGSLTCGNIQLLSSAFSRSSNGSNLRLSFFFLFGYLLR